MRKILLAAAALLIGAGFSSKAQEGIDSCLMYISYYQDYYKQGTKASRMEAMRSWRNAYSICKPGVRQNLYNHGGVLYRMLIEVNHDKPEYVKALVDTLMNIDRTRIEYYASNPKFTKACYDNYSADIINYLLDRDPERAYKELTSIIDVRGIESTPTTFVSRMNAAITLYKNGKFNVDDVVNCYNDTESLFAKLEKVDSTQNVKDLHTTAQVLFVSSKIASCENLVAIYTPKFDSMKGDYDQVSKLVKMLSAAGNCVSQDLYLKAVTQMHALQPNATSAYYLSHLYASRGDNKEALRYLEEACQQEIDKDERAKDYYELAQNYLNAGSYGKAISSANKAMEGSSEYIGKSYLIIGQAWMSMSCGGEGPLGRAKFWVAADFFSRAKSADPSVTATANRLLGQCAAYYPSTSDAFMYDLQNGQSYTVSCGGMRASTVVRTK